VVDLPWIPSIMHRCQATLLVTPVPGSETCVALHSRRTVSDFAMGDNMLGLIVAALSVVSSGMQQIFCRSMQQKHKLSSHELLSNTAPAQVRLIIHNTIKLTTKFNLVHYHLITSKKLPLLPPPFQASQGFQNLALRCRRL